MSSWLQLAHKTAIVSGAGSGIGAAVAMALANQHECRVVAADASRENLEALLNHYRHNNNGNHPQKMITTIRCNVRDEQDVHRLFQHEQAQEASILVNCAGITRDAMLTSMTTQQWTDVLDVNLLGTFLMCREFLRVSSSQKTTSGSSRSIVNVGSVVSEQGNVGQANYAASKGGVLGLTRALAKEYAAKDVRVNAVVPGFIDTEMVRKVPEKIRAQILPKVAMGRYGTPEDVTNLILFLASQERSGFITGECIECSGMISL